MGFYLNSKKYLANRLISRWILIERKSWLRSIKLFKGYCKGYKHKRIGALAKQKWKI